MGGGHLPSLAGLTTLPQGLKVAKSLNLGSLLREASILPSVLRLTGKGYRQGEAVGYTKLLYVHAAEVESARQSSGDKHHLIHRRYSKRIAVGDEEIKVPVLKRVFSCISEPALLALLLVGGLVLWGAMALVPLSFFVLLGRVTAWASVDPVRQATSTVALGILGYGFFLLRAHHRLLYGAFEILVACIGFWYALGTTANLQGSAAAIIASLYVFVRGVDNYKQGITDQHRRMGLDDQHRPLAAAPAAMDGIEASTGHITPACTGRPASPSAR